MTNVPEEFGSLVFDGRVMKLSCFSAVMPVSG